MTETTLTDMLEEEIRKGTFTADALAQFQEISERAKALEIQCENQAHAVEALTSTLRERENERDRAIDALRTAEDMAKKNAESDVNLARAEAKSHAIEHCFELVFRNAQVHRSVTSSVPVTETRYDGGGTYSHTCQHATTEEITEEQK